MVLDTSKYAPKFKLGFTVMSVLSVGEFVMIFVIRWFVNRDAKKEKERERVEEELSVAGSAPSDKLKKLESRDGVAHAPVVF